MVLSSLKQGDVLPASGLFETLSPENILLTVLSVKTTPKGKIVQLTATYHGVLLGTVTMSDGKNFTFEEA